MDKWECTVCGYVYDPQPGDSKRGILSGITFEELPENWSCPVCGAPKVLFKKKP